MQVQQIFPNSDLNSGIKSLLSKDSISSFFKKFCTAIESRTRYIKKARNSKYRNIDYLRVFFYSEIIGRSIHDTSELLNAFFLSQRRGRRKKYSDGRKEREIPHQTEVNAFLRKFGLKKASNILRECLDFQLKEALDRELISKRVIVLIDFTEHAYYGKRNDKMIKGTNRQKGTKKMRHYLGFSILSRNTHLFAGLEQVSNGQFKIPLIIKFLENLLNLGFQLNYVLMDREFYRTELLVEIKRKKGKVIIPAKFYKVIKQYIEEYLNGKKDRVRKYTFSTATASKFKASQHVYLIIKAKRGYSLQRVRRDFQQKNLPLKDAQKRLFAIMTTEKLKRKSSSWASRVSLFYRRRWLIETGFSDLNRINRRWKSSLDNVRYFDMLARMVLYNSWKTNKQQLKKMKILQQKRIQWSLNQNQDLLKSALLVN